MFCDMVRPMVQIHAGFVFSSFLPIRDSDWNVGVKFVCGFQFVAGRCLLLPESNSGSDQGEQPRRADFNFELQTT